jgi:hypothetical protein
MSVVLLVMTDGRMECIDRAIPSALEHLHGPITRKVIFDDSNSSEYRSWLRNRFPDFELTYHPAGRQGFSGAYRTAWELLALGGTNGYVFGTEDDFVFRRDIDLEAMIGVLDEFPYIAQIALRRQAWNDQEKAAGGIVEQHPEAYTDCFDAADRWWLEHRLFWTTNPSLYRRSMCLRAWPEGAHSEGLFTHQLLADPAVRFAFWGDRDSGEWVEHIGYERVGHGY